MSYAFFDLDHTITRKDTGMLFFLFWLRRYPHQFWRLLAAPGWIIAWKLRLTSLKKLKEFFFGFLRGFSEETVAAAAREFADTIFPAVCKPEALTEINRLRDKGLRIVLVSASPEFYVRFLGDKLGADYVAGTLYELKKGLYTGKMHGQDCRGAEKVLRIEKLIPLEELPVPASVAYSDSSADLPMLRLAERAYRVHPGRWELSEAHW